MKPKVNQENFFKGTVGLRRKVSFMKTEIEGYKSILRAVKKLIKKSSFEEKGAFHYLWHIDFNGHTETIVIGLDEHHHINSWLEGEFE